VHATTLRLLLLAGFLLMGPPVLARFDDGARYAFVASAAAKSVFVIDLVERSLVHTLPLGDAPDSLAVSDRVKALAIGHVGARRLTLVDLGDDKLVPLDYPLSLAPNAILVSPTGESIAVYDSTAGILQVHSLRRREILLAADAVHTTAPLSFSTDGATVYWTDDAAGTVNSVDLWGARASVRLAEAGAGLSAMSRSIDGSLGFVSAASSNVVHIVDLLRFAVMAQTPAGSRPGRPWGTSDGRFMLVPNKGDGTVTAIATLTGESRYTVTAVDAPLFVNPGWLDTVAAAVGESGELVFLDVESGTVLARSRLGGTPLDGVVTSDSKTLAIPVPGMGTVTFFDMRRQARVSAIEGLPRDLGPAQVAISNNLCH